MRANLLLITLAEILALALWFSGTAAGPGLLAEAAAPVAGFQSWLTSAVQAGFVVGTLASAALALPDRFDPRRVFAAAAVLGAAANAVILVLPPGHLADLACRFATGIALAGIYPVGMKLAVGWADRNAGFVIGLLVGGLTLGSALPHLVNALGGLGWRPTIATASATAAASAVLILRVRLGPWHATAPRFSPAQALLLLCERGTRLAMLGYLGHMWELYAMWAWIGAYLSASFAAYGDAASAGPGLASLATFAVIGVGALGSVAAGLLADRFGRIRVTCAAMLASAACCLLAGPCFGAPPAVTVALGLVWGIAAVADSAQFSACIAELAPPGLTGTFLTVQVCIGFSLTLLAIQLMPWFIAIAGWDGAFAILALGPLFGTAAMLTLRGTPEAARLAGGRAIVAPFPPP